MAFDPFNLEEQKMPQKASVQTDALPVALLASTLLAPEAAVAKGGKYGLMEGRTLSLLHPIAMAGLFGVALYSAYSGWQFRRMRTIGGDIQELKASIKIPAAQLKAAQAAEEPDAIHIASLQRQVAPTLAQIDELTKTRKTLSAGGFRDLHYNLGSLLLGAGVLFAIEGPLNTYARADKLFPGPHLFYGAALPVCWALAAAMVPAMQKGNDAARYAHIGLNGLSVFLFASQIPTGWEITQKVIKFTSWP